MRLIPLTQEPIKYLADYQRNWSAFVEPLKRDKYVVESTNELSIHGDAPKCFLRIKEYREGHINGRPGAWPKYIAKVGSKWYPIESITEHLITRIGQICQFKVARSQLRMVGKQVRFLSRYFLRRAESLTHGIEIFQENLGKAMVQDIAEERLETEFYTFPLVVDYLTKAFPEEADTILSDFVEMLAFDAVIGNNDRHPANWGIITSMKQDIPSRFSPIFDTARGLFWNMNEDGVRNRLKNPRNLETYIEKSAPQIGWTGVPKLNHFSLLSLIYQNYPPFRAPLTKCGQIVDLEECAKILTAEFRELLSEQRISLIIKCLELRMARYRDALA